MWDYPEDWYYEWLVALFHHAMTNSAIRARHRMHRAIKPKTPHIRVTMRSVNRNR